jgi:hypothetical protein
MALRLDKHAFCLDIFCGFAIHLKDSLGDNS